MTNTNTNKEGKIEYDLPQCPSCGGRRTASQSEAMIEDCPMVDIKEIHSKDCPLVVKWAVVYGTKED